MKILTKFIVLSCMCFFTSCSQFQLIPMKDCETFSGIPGPEDFSVDTKYGRRLIFSSQDRRAKDENNENKYQGNIYYLKTNNGEIKKLTIVDRDDYPFHPHGIDYIKKGNTGFLYVVNHALSDQHSIEKFRVAKKKLHFVKRYRSDLLIHPNDLVATQEGFVYITNDRKYTSFIGYLGDLFRFAWSNVVVLDTKTGVFEVVAEGIAYANGIAVDQNHLYVAGLRDDSIHVYNRDRTTGKVFGKASQIYIGSGVDNLLWERNGVLNVAAHPDIFAFIDHVESDKNHSPSEVYRIILDFNGKHKVERIFADDGKLIDASSTGLVLKKKLYVSGVFDPEIVVCRLK